VQPSALHRQLFGFRVGQSGRTSTLPRWLHRERSHLTSRAKLGPDYKMRHRDPHDDPPRRRDREPSKPVATLGQIHTEPYWCWLCCTNSMVCSHSKPVAMAQFVIRYGPNTSSDIVRQRARCTVCGHKGASLRYPSWVNRTVGVQPFPVERMS
jgi:hypothetical protein